MLFPKPSLKFSILPRKSWLSLVLLGLIVCLGSGCVHRRMMINSNPVGALVYVDGKEAGFTPTAVSFDYYGTREIKLVKDGYKTLTVLQKVPPPWYQLPGIEFLADNFTPGKVTDRQSFQYQMQRQQVPSGNELKERSKAFRSETQFSY